MYDKVSVKRFGMSEHTITLTHLNIRQSIAILLSKLVLADILVAIVVIGFYFLLVQGEQYMQIIGKYTIAILIIFALFGIIKIGLTVYIVLQWLFEYYEITPEAVIHKKGIIERKTEKYNLKNVRKVIIHDTFLGELFNFATVTLFDIRLNKYLDMYLIHNPDRYVKILKQIRPHLETKTDHVNIPLLRMRGESDDFDPNQP